MFCYFSPSWLGSETWKQQEWWWGHSLVEVGVMGLGCSPQALKFTISRAALCHLCHTGLSQLSVMGTSQTCHHCLSWSMPKSELNSFPFLELISFNPTIVSPCIYARKYHQDSLLWFPDVRKAASLQRLSSNLSDAPEIPIKSYQFDMIIFKMYTLLGVVGEDFRLSIHSTIPTYWTPITSKTLLDPLSLHVRNSRSSQLLVINHL